MEKGWIAWKSVANESKANFYTQTSTQARATSTPLKWAPFKLLTKSQYFHWSIHKTLGVASELGLRPFPDADPDAGGGATLSDGHCSTTFYLDSLACSCCKETCSERREGEGLDPQKLDPDVMQRHSVYINMLFNYHANQLSFLSESCNISNVTTTILV